MVENVSKMWHIINVKTPSDGKRLNDGDRLPITDINDPRLVALMEIVECFKSMESKYIHRVYSLTDDTRTWSCRYGKNVFSRERIPLRFIWTVSK